jgi:hypothetical protein
MRETINAYNASVKKSLKERNHLEDLGVDGSQRNRMGVVWAGLICPEIGTSGGML